MTHQHDNTPVEDSSVVAVATGWAQERLLEDVTAAGKQTVNSWLIFRVYQTLHIPSCVLISSLRWHVNGTFSCILKISTTPGGTMRRQRGLILHFDGSIWFAGGCMTQPELIATRCSSQIIYTFLSWLFSLLHLTVIKKTPAEISLISQSQWLLNKWNTSSSLVFAPTTAPGNERVVRNVG